MRDIEFRGKDQTGIMNKDWLYGSLDLTKNSEFPIILCKDRFDNVMHIQVEKETIGQYVGKEDINDTRIYEGDIVRIETVDNCGNMNGFIGIVVFHDCCFELQNIEDSEVFEGLCFYNNEDLEVIGNIFDNPNLLEVEE